MKIELKNVTLMIIDCVETNRAEKVLDISSENINFAEIKFLTSLESNSPYKIKIPHIGSVEDFSKFCIKDLHKYVDTDFVLLVQYDGFILNANSWNDNFFDYDYVGAPWYIEEEFWFDMFDIPRELIGTHIVGNGGFSLRSKKFLETSARLATQNVFKKYHPEDLVLCVYDKNLLDNEGIKFAPYEIAKEFSIEGTDEVYSKQFGFHNLKWTDISKWIHENPKWNIKSTYKKDK